MSYFVLSSYGLPSGPSELGLAGLSADAHAAAFEYGIVSSTSEGYASGGSLGGLAAGSSETYVTNNVGNLRLKIVSKDLCNPVTILCLFRYQVDVTSDVYKRLLDSVEEIKTMLGRIARDNEIKE